MTKIYIAMLCFFAFYTTSVGSADTPSIAAISTTTPQQTKIKGERSEGKRIGFNPVGHWVYWYDNGQKKMEGDYELKTYRNLPESYMVGNWRFWSKEGKKLDISKILSAFKNKLKWVDLRQTGQTLWLTVVTPDYTRREYIYKKINSSPILYFKHGRFIGPTLGHHENYVLIDNNLSSRLNEIHISDLTNGKSWRIDKKALRHFQETYLKTHSKIKCGAVHWYFPSADGFSPDDTKVLIRMEIEYTYPCTDPMFNPVSYVVDSKSGDILKEYTSIKVPEQWWIDNL